MRSKILLVLTVAFLLIPAGANAGMLGIGGHLGYFDITDEREGYFGGLHARLRLPLLLSVEGALDYHPSSVRTVEGTDPDTGLDVTTYPITISALTYPFPLLYLLGGVGWYNTRLERVDADDAVGRSSDTNDNFGIHFGAGLDIPIWEGRSVNADVRYVFLDYDARKLELDGVKDLDADYVSIQIGLTFHF